MKPKLLLLCFLPLVCIVACKKASVESKEITFPRKLYATGVVSRSGLRVFTATDDITDTALKLKFLGAQQKDFNFTLPAGDTSSITFLNRDTMVFNSSVAKYEVFNRDDLFLFSAPDYKINVNGPADVLYTFLRYTGQYLSFPVANGTAYLTKEVDAAHGDYDSLTLSVLVYKLTSGPYPATYQMFTGTVFNEFNYGADLNMGKNDTLAIQQWAITYKVR